jgi:hypothetical protein
VATARDGSVGLTAVPCGIRRISAGVSTDDEAPVSARVSTDAAAVATSVFSHRLMSVST